MSMPDTLSPTLSLKGEGVVSSSHSLPLQGEGQGEGASYIGGVNRYARARTKKNAKELRGQLTEAEKKLWYHLRAQRFERYKFRRQHPIGNYSADFICLKQKVIIEVDGGQHAKNEKDVIRTRFLEDEGFTVLRFWNNVVLDNIESVLQAIFNTLTLTLTLSLKGRGNKAEVSDE